LLNGCRQAGKSTIVAMIGANLRVCVFVPGNAFRRPSSFFPGIDATIKAITRRMIVNPIA
jgi:hypothetical protein